jgi:hypothetical protein
LEGAAQLLAGDAEESSKVFQQLGGGCRSLNLALLLLLLLL